MRSDERFELCRLGERGGREVELAAARSRALRERHRDLRRERARIDDGPYDLVQRFLADLDRCPDPVGAVLELVRIGYAAEFGVKVEPGAWERWSYRFQRGVFHAPDGQDSAFLFRPKRVL